MKDEKDKLIKFQVHCNRERPNIYDMEIDLIYSEVDEKYMPFPECQGCKEFNGSKECERCTGSITIMFNNDPDLDASKPLYI